MIGWLRERIEDNGLFVHRYTVRTRSERWVCRGLFDAFRQYRWRRQNWADNKAELDAYRVRLRGAVAAGDSKQLSAVCEDVLKWGGVWANNGAYIARRHDVLLDEVSCLAKVLASEDEPSRTDIRRNPNDTETECRMNAGFVKIYSLLLDCFVIYDGRVGAALGLLVRRFCEESGRESVPPLLAFAYGVPKEATNTNEPKQRDPSTSEYKFPRLSTNSHLHCVQAMRASWLLRETLATEVEPIHGGRGRIPRTRRRAIHDWLRPERE